MVVLGSKMGVLVVVALLEVWGSTLEVAAEAEHSSRRRRVIAAAGWEMVLLGTQSGMCQLEQSCCLP